MFALTLYTSYARTRTRTHRWEELLHALGDLRGVHQQCVDDAIASLAAADCLDAAVVVAQCEVGLCAVLHKLPLEFDTCPGSNHCLTDVGFLKPQIVWLSLRTMWYPFMSLRSEFFRQMPSMPGAVNI